MPPRKPRINKVQTPLLPKGTAFTRDEAMALRPTLSLYTFRAETGDKWILFYTRVDNQVVYFGYYSDAGQHESPYGHEIEANQAFHEFVQGYDKAYREFHA
jgi:hypothetical protein